ncbi:MAG: hypothetical protein K6G81_10410, partial [Lachnospiraceae bacterium]|nr:hypothetical protein [Lachnospiraceae bacterium]
MERYRNFVRLEQMKENIRSGRQTDALEIAETLDLKRLKSNADIGLIADLYMENGMYERAYEALKEIHARKPGRTVLMQLINLTLTLKDPAEAEVYYEEFHKLAPNDYYNYIYRYNIDKLEKKGLDILIDDLEALKRVEYIEIWAYELAKLYHKAGLGEKCVKECKDIEIWFGDGQYVDRAKALRKYYRGELELKEETENEPEAGVTSDVPKETAEAADGADFGSSEEYTESEDVPEEAEYGEDPGSSEEYTESERVPEEAEYSEDSGSSEEYTEAGEASGAAEDSDRDIYEGHAKSGEAAEPAADIDGSEGSPAGAAGSEAQEKFEDDTEESVSDITAQIMEMSITDILAGSKLPQGSSKAKQRLGEELRRAGVDDPAAEDTARTETSDDFEEELRDYDEAAAVETVDINLKGGLPEGDEAVISGMIEQGMTDLAMEVNAELEKEHADEERWKKTRREYKERKEGYNPQKPDNKTGVSVNEAEVTQKSSIEVAQYEPEKKPVDKESLLGKFLSKRGEQLENYYGFLSYHAVVGTQLIKTLEILLNPQIKNICLVVTGVDEKELDIIIKGTARIMYNSGYLEHKQIFNSKAEKLDAEDLENKVGKLIGSCFVIRQAGDLKADAASKLFALNEKLLGATVVVLTDEKSRMNGLFRDNRELNSMFPQRIHIPDVEEKDVRDYIMYCIHAEGYLLEKGANTEAEKITRSLCHRDNAILEAEKLVSTLSITSFTMNIIRGYNFYAIFICFLNQNGINLLLF